MRSSNISRNVRAVMVVGATLLVLAGLAGAKKPPTPPPPDPATGTVLFEYGGGSNWCDWGWHMSADDGSGKQLIVDSFSDAGYPRGPSRQTYDGIRWWLVVRETDDLYDEVVRLDGSIAYNVPPRDLFAVGFASGIVVAEARLTEYFGTFTFDPTGNQVSLQFSPNDLTIAATGQDVTEAIEYVDGIWRVYSAARKPVVARIHLSAAEIGTAGFTSSTPDDGHLEYVIDDRFPNLVSPTDDLMVVCADTGLWLVVPPGVGQTPRALGGPGTLLIYDGSHNGLLDWSPDGMRILFTDGMQNAESIQIDGTDLRFEMPQRQDAAGKINRYSDFAYTSDGQHLVYRHRVQKTVQILGEYLERRNLATGNVVNLTADLDPFIAKRVTLVVP